MKGKHVIHICILIVVLAGCVRATDIPVSKPIETPTPVLLPVEPGKLPPLADDLEKKSLLDALEKSLLYYQNLPTSTRFSFGERTVTLGEMKESLLAFQELLRRYEENEIPWERICENFDVYRAGGFNENGTVLFTGYFEPILEGSLQETADYRYPIYGVPPDVVVVHLSRFHKKYGNDRIVGRLKNGELVPYYTRKEIEEGRVLRGKAPELAWVKDPVELFFLHIQGSGKIVLTDGTLLHISYANSNGRPYRSIGKYLLEKGKIPQGELTHSALKKYLREHPEELMDILNVNESYVFFRVVEQGPVGALGFPLTAGRSIATDLDLFPRGALAFIRLRKPIFDADGNIKEWKPFSRFVLNHDTGGVIKGPRRVDLFCGTGREGEMLAGSLKENGELYFLVKKRKNSLPAFPHSR